MVVATRFSQRLRLEALSEINWVRVNGAYGWGGVGAWTLFYDCVCQPGLCPFPYRDCKRTNPTNCIYLGVIEEVLKQFKKQTEYPSILSYVNQLRRDGR